MLTAVFSHGHESLKPPVHYLAHNSWPSLTHYQPSPQPTT